MRGKVRVKKSKCFIRKIVVEKYSKENGNEKTKVEEKFDVPRCRQHSDQRSHQRCSEENNLKGGTNLVEETEAITMESQLSVRDCDSNEKYEKSDLKCRKFFYPHLADPIKKCPEGRRPSVPNQNLAEDQNPGIHFDHEKSVSPSAVQSSSSNGNTQEKFDRDKIKEVEKWKATCSHLLTDLLANILIFVYCLFLLVIQSISSAIAKISRNDFLKGRMNSFNKDDSNTKRETGEKKTYEEKSKSEANLETSLSERVPKVISGLVAEKDLTPSKAKSDNAELKQDRMVGNPSDCLEDPAEFECDLFDILTSQMALIGIWLFNWFACVIQTIDSRTKTLIDSYVGDNGSNNVNSHCQSEPRMCGSQKNLEKCGIFRTLIEDMETDRDKVSTLDVIQNELMSLIEPETEKTQLIITPKSQKTPAAQREILPKVSRQETVLTADANMNAEMPKRNDIKAPISNETEIVSVIEGQSTIQEAKEFEEYLESETSKLFHAAGVDNCFKFMLEKFCPELAAAIEQLRMNEVYQIEDVGKETSVSSSIVHEATLSNCYMFLVEYYHPALALILKKFCDGQEIEMDLFTQK